MRYNYTWGGLGLWEVPLKSPTGNLLLVSKQFYKDVKYILDLLPNVYHVDVMVVKDHGLWPTWHCLKLPSSDVTEEVTATFRIFEPTDDLDARFKGSLSFRPGDGGPISAVWAFHQLFLNLTSHGPGLTPKDPLSRSAGPPKYITKRITMNILSPTDGVAHTKLWCREDESPRWLLFFASMPMFGVPRPPEEQLVRFIASGMSVVSRLSRDSFPYTARYYENLLKGISHRLNGVEFSRLDLDQAMDDLYSQKRLGLVLRRQCRGVRKMRTRMKMRFAHEQ